MTRIRFEDLPSTNTPRNAENLNKLNNVVISPTEPTTGEEVWIQKVNLDEGEFQFKDIETDTGEEKDGVSKDFVTTKEFMSVKSLTRYLISYKNISETYSQVLVYEYDANKVYLGFSFLNFTDKYDFTTKENTAYIKIRLHTTQTSDYNVTIVEGFRKIFVKNDNGGYDEFYNEENSKRKILWTNPNPTSSFGGQTITTSKDYTMYSVVYAVKISGYYYYMSTGILPYDLRASLQSVGEGAMRRRNIESISLGSFAFNVCKELNNNIEDNADCIPVQIIGYN